MKLRISMIALVAAMAVLMALTMTACQSDEGNDAEDEPRPTVEVGDEGIVFDGEERVPDPNLSATIGIGIWPQEHEAQDVAMHKAIVDDMLEYFPNVKCEPAFYAYEPETYTPMAQGGRAPTIFQPWLTEPKRLIAAGIVGDITDELGPDGVNWARYMTESYRNILSDSEGRIYGIPRDSYALGMYININLFERAGLVDANGLPQYPKTFEELSVAAKKIKDEAGVAGFCLVGAGARAGMEFTNVAWNFGAELLYQDEGTGKWMAGLNSEEAVAALQWLKDLKWEYDAITDDPLMETQEKACNKVGTGLAAMCFGANDWVNVPTKTAGLDPLKFALVPVPKGPNGDQYLLGGGTTYMFAPNATSDEKIAALRYIEFMGKAPVATKEAFEGLKNDAKKNLESGIPIIPRIPAWNNPNYDKMEKAAQEAYRKEQGIDMRLYQDYYDAVEVGLRAEPTYLAQEMYAELGRAISKVLREEDRDCKDVLDTAQEKYQGYLDNDVNV
ncbi:MAG: extracellular solute-binding protein [Oscillospiraceae bacterium]|nr:extracellular solute-binding protein [Oscillospiraceae bacterium]